MVIYPIHMLLVAVMVLGIGAGPGLAANGPVPLAPQDPKLKAQSPAATPGPSAAAPSLPSQAGLVSLNFTGADLVEVIHVLAQYLKLNYTIDPAVRGTVTLYSARPLRQADLLPVFHQVLRMNNAVAVKGGNFYHIAPIKDGRGLVRPSRRLGEHGYILQVVPVRFFSVTEMRRLLEPFITPGGDIIEYPRGNFLIILDLAANIQRLLEIMDLIDVNVFAGVRMELYQPKAASAEELAQEMERIMQAYAASAPQSENFVAQFIPVPRINRLLVISHSEGAWTYAQRWLRTIDTYAEGPGRRIFVYPVENGKAIDLADILNQVLGQAQTGPRTRPRTLRDIHGRVSGGQQPAAGGAPSAGQGEGSAGVAGTLYAVAPTQAQPSQTRPRTGARPTPSPAVGGGGERDQVRIVPDPATNSLIIFGTGQEFQNIKNILKKIDIMPRQVLLDVLIAEVTLADDFKFGVEYEIKRTNGDVRIFNREFGQRASILSGLVGPLAAGGPGPQVLSAVIGTGDALRGLIQALKSDSRVKVLSSPSILATDNQPARIQVGTEEPIATGTVSAPVSGGTTSSTTIQYRNTGRILTIIPQVNAAGLVTLQIKAEVSQRGADVQVGGANNTFPSFDTRDVETTAVVQDGETLAIGGIITERVTRSRVGIPFLMDVPIFGRFFGTTTDDIDRTELIMLITPHVIRSREEARSVTEEFKNRLLPVINQYREVIERLHGPEKWRPGDPVEGAPLENKDTSTTPDRQDTQSSSKKVIIVLPSKQQAWEKLSFKVDPSKPAEGSYEVEGSVKQGPPLISPTPRRTDTFTQELLSELVREIEHRYQTQGEGSGAIGRSGGPVNVVGKVIGSDIQGSSPTASVQGESRDKPDRLHETSQLAGSASASAADVSPSEKGTSDSTLDKKSTATTKAGGSPLSWLSGTKKSAPSELKYSRQNTKESTTSEIKDVAGSLHSEESFFDDDEEGLTLLIAGETPLPAQSNLPSGEKVSELSEHENKSVKVHGERVTAAGKDQSLKLSQPGPSRNMTRAKVNENTGKAKMKVPSNTLTTSTSKPERSPSAVAVRPSLAEIYARLEIDSDLDVPMLTPESAEPPTEERLALMEEEEEIPESVLRAWARQRQLAISLVKKKLEKRVTSAAKPKSTRVTKRNTPMAVATKTARKTSKAVNSVNLINPKGPFKIANLAKKTQKAKVAKVAKVSKGKVKQKSGGKSVIMPAVGKLSSAKVRGTDSINRVKTSAPAAPISKTKKKLFSAVKKQKKPKKENIAKVTGPIVGYGPLALAGKGTEGSRKSTAGAPKLGKVSGRTYTHHRKPSGLTRKTSPREKPGDSKITMKATVSFPAAKESSSLGKRSPSVVSKKAPARAKSRSIPKEWLSTMGLRFEKKKAEASSSVVKPVKVAQAATHRSTSRPSTGKNPEVVKEVVPFGQEAEKALKGEKAPTMPTLEPAPKKRAGRATIVVKTRPVVKKVITSKKAKKEKKARRASVAEKTPWEAPLRLTKPSHQIKKVNRKTQIAKRGGRGPSIWSVQVNAFAREARARSLVQRLRMGGYDAYVVKVKVKGRNWHRVRVGRFTGSRTAKEVLASLKKEKQYRQAYVVVSRK